MITFSLSHFLPFSRHISTDETEVNATIQELESKQTYLKILEFPWAIKENYKKQLARIKKSTQGEGDPSAISLRWAAFMVSGILGSVAIEAFVNNPSSIPKEFLDFFINNSAPFINMGAGFAIFGPVGLAIGDIYAHKIHYLEELKSLLKSNKFTLPQINTIIKNDKDMGVYNDKDLDDRDLIFETEKKFAEGGNQVINFGSKAVESQTKDIQNNILVFNKASRAAIKTLVGLIFIITSLTISALIATGASGSLLLFALSPAWSVSIIGALAIFYGKMTYPRGTAIREIINAVVNTIFLPIRSLGQLGSWIPYPIFKQQTLFQQKKYVQLAINLLSAVFVASVSALPLLLIQALIPGAVIAGGVVAASTLGAYIGLATAVAVTDLAQYLTYKFNSIHKNLKIISARDNFITPLLTSENEDFRVIAPKLLENLKRVKDNISNAHYEKFLEECHPEYYQEYIINKKSQKESANNNVENYKDEEKHIINLCESFAKLSTDEEEIYPSKKEELIFFLKEQYLKSRECLISEALKPGPIDVSKINEQTSICRIANSIKALSTP